MKINWGKVFVYLMVAFIVGIGIGLPISQQQTIRELQQQLNETQEQLHISNDQLKQIYMRQEAEYYMNQMEEEENAKN